ncbi:MAG: glutamate 5-kinase [Tomitella sp.]|nr:glutamate 5-kinase [Tomitella sp.]
MSTRKVISTAKRVVVKIGSSALTSLDGGLDEERLGTLAEAIEGRMRAGSDVVVVSSGAVSAGIAPLGLGRRPRDLATKQAAAAVGQLELVGAWSRAFGRHDRTVAQVLLTAGDFARRDSHRNAQRTLDRLRALHAVAVVNENDTVATSEIKFGDNDRLAALVAHLVSADALILLSDVDGLYDSDPREGDARFIDEVAGPDDLAEVVAGTGGSLGTGGMATKLSAAVLGADGGIPVLLAGASSAAEALAGADAGTVFAAREDRMSARRFWVRHAADAAGSLHLDAGAVAAVSQRRRSLLAAGITGVSGHFSAGDVVELRGPDETVVARGVVAYDSSELPRMIGHSTGALPEDLRHAVVHADGLVPL